MPLKSVRAHGLFNAMWCEDDAARCFTLDGVVNLDAPFTTRAKGCAVATLEGAGDRRSECVGLHLRGFESRADSRGAASEPDAVAPCTLLTLRHGRALARLFVAAVDQPRRTGSSFGIPPAWAHGT